MALHMELHGPGGLFPEFAEDLRDVDGFSHVFLIYHFH